MSNYAQKIKNKVTDDCWDIPGYREVRKTYIWGRTEEVLGRLRGRGNRADAKTIALQEFDTFVEHERKVAVEKFREENGL